MILELSLQIRLTWLTFALERCGDRCTCDSIEVYDNSTEAREGGLIGR